MYTEKFKAAVKNDVLKRLDEDENFAYQFGELCQNLDENSIRNIAYEKYAQKPEFKKYLEQEQGYFSKVGDDLSNIGKAWNAGNFYSHGGWNDIAKNIINGGTAEDREKLFQNYLKWESQNQMPQNKTIVGDVVNGIANLVPLTVDMLPEAATVGAGTGAVGAVGGSVVPGIGTVAGGIGGFKAGATASMIEQSYKVGVADIYTALRKDGIDDETAKNWAIWAGIPYGALEYAGKAFAPISRTFLNGKVLKEFIDKISDEKIKNKILNTAVKYGADVALTGTLETGTEGGQAGVVEFAKQGSQGKGYDAGKVVSEAWNEAKAVAPAMYGMAGLGIPLEATANRITNRTSDKKNVQNAIIEGKDFQPIPKSVKEGEIFVVNNKAYQNINGKAVEYNVELTETDNLEADAENDNSFKQKNEKTKVQLGEDGKLYATSDNEIKQVGNADFSGENAALYYQPFANHPSLQNLVFDREKQAELEQAEKRQAELEAQAEADMELEAKAKAFQQKQDAKARKSFNAQNRINAISKKIDRIDDVSVRLDAMELEYENGNIDKLTDNQLQEAFEHGYSWAEAELNKRSLQDSQGITLLDVLKELRIKLPTPQAIIRDAQDKGYKNVSGYLYGEINDLYNSLPKDKRLRYFSKKHRDLDTVAEELAQYGFYYDSEADFISDVAENLSGRKVSTGYQFSLAKNDYSKMSDQELIEAHAKAEQVKDEKAGQAITDEWLKRKGYTTDTYHGSPKNDITEFKEESYFTKDKDYAKRYKRGENGKIYETKLNLKKPFDTRNPKERAIFEKEFYRKWGNGAPLSERGLPDWTDGSDLLEFLDENGYDYDGIILDEGADGGYGEAVKQRGESYVPRSASQIKSRDAFTYGDDGKYIPLDKRGDINNPDIRFSIKEGDAQRFRNELQDYIDGKLDNRHVFRLGTTPEALKLVGADDLPIELSASVLERKEEKHSLVLENLKNLPEELSDPIAILQSSTIPNAITVITELPSADKHNMLVAIHLNKKVGKAEINSIRSLYPKSQFGIQTAINRGELRYINTKRKPYWITLPFQHASGRKTIQKGYGHEIFTQEDLSQEEKDNIFRLRGENPQYRYSVSDGNSNSKAESIKQEVLNIKSNFDKKAKHKSNVEIVGTVNEARENLGGSIPGNARGIQSGNRIILVAENLDDAETGARVFLHEQVGHFGLRGLLGKDLRPFLNYVIKHYKGTKAWNDIASKADYTKQGDYAIAEEVLAHLSENRELSDPSMWKRLVHKVKRALWGNGVAQEYVNLLDEDVLRSAIVLSREWAKGDHYLNTNGVWESVKNTRRAKDIPEDKKKFSLGETRTPEELDELNAKFRDLYEQYKNGDQDAYKQAVELVKAEAERKGYAVKVYHGTDADRFNVADATSSHEENGEGNQAHGAGLYMAVSRETAEGYREAINNEVYYIIGDKNLSDLGITEENLGINQNDIEYILDALEDDNEESIVNYYNRLIREAEDWIRSDRKRLANLGNETDRDYLEKKYKERIEHEQKEIATYEKCQTAIEQIKDILRDNGYDNFDIEASYGGTVFNWFTNLNESNTLDEDKPFNKQNKEVQEKLKKAVYALTDKQLGGLSKDDIWKDFSYADGGFIYDEFVKFTGSKLKASEHLLKHGIKGIRYDGRQDGRCYVSFEGGSAVKLQDPFTFDDNGELIPLSERFNENNHDMRFSLIGEKGIYNYGSEYQDRLETAKELDAQGVHPAVIWQKTGWAKNKLDGKWRYEITDGEVKPNIKPNRIYNLEEVYDAEALYLAYPELRDTFIQFKPLVNGGGALVDNSYIVVDNFFADNPKALRRILIHEIQHWIQGVEGWNTGSAEQYFKDDKSEREQRLDEVLQRKEYIEFEIKRIEATGDYKEVSQKLIQDLVDKKITEAEFDAQYEQLLSNTQAKYGQSNLKSLVEEKSALIAEEMKLIDAIANESNLTAYDKYMRTAGEVEARNAVKRQTELTAEQRRKLPPEATQDFPYEEQIVFEGKNKQADFPINVGNYFRQIKDELPIDETAEPVLLDNAGGDIERFKRASEVFNTMPMFTHASDGVKIKLKVSEGGSMDRRVVHMISDNQRGGIDASKLAWLPNIRSTIENAQIRLKGKYDPRKQRKDTEPNRIYIRRYKDGTIHAVVVSPFGEIIGQDIKSANVITQYPIEKIGEVYDATVEWINPNMTKASNTKSEASHINDLSHKGTVPSPKTNSPTSNSSTISDSRHLSMSESSENNSESQAHFSLGNEEELSEKEKAKLYKQKRVRELITSKAGRAVQATMDAFSALASLERVVKGKIQDASKSAWKMALMTRNLDQVMFHLLNVGNIEYEKTTGTFKAREGTIGLKKILEPVKKNYQNFQNYALAKCALQRWAILRKQNFYTEKTFKETFGFTEDEARQWVKEGNEKTQKAFKQLQGFFQAQRKFMLETGLISEDRYNALSRFTNYVPFFRMGEDLDAEAQETFDKAMELNPGGRGFSGRDSGIKTFEGSARQTKDLIENIINQARSVMDAGYKNIAMYRSLNLMREIGLADYIKQDSEEARATLGEMKKRLEEQGFNVSEMSDEDIMRKNPIEVFYDVSATDEREQKDIVSVRVNGGLRFYRVNDKELLVAIKNFGGEKFNVAWKLLTIPKNIMTSAITKLPEFAIRNFIRDTGSNTILFGGKNVPGYIAKTIANIGQVAFNDAFMKKQWASGAGGGTWYSVKAEDFASNFKGDAWSKTKRVGKYVVRPATWFLQQYERRVLMPSEQANRATVMKQALNNGASDMEAAFQAMDVLNFGMRGSGVWTGDNEWAKATAKIFQAVVRITPFLNARLQGLYKIWRESGASDGAYSQSEQFGLANRTKAFVQKVSKGILMRATMLAGTAVLYSIYANSSEDDDGEKWYEKLSSEDKLNYWHFYLGENTIVRIPKPFEIGLMFATVPETMVNALIQNRPDTLEVLKKGLFNTLELDPMANPVLDTIREQISNKDSFTGRPIVQQSDRELSPKHQYDASTSASAKAIAKVFSGLGLSDTWLASPARVQNAIGNMFAGMTRYITAASDPIIESITDIEGGTSRYARESILRQPFAWATRNTKTMNTRNNTDFYDLRARCRELYASARLLRQEGRMQEVQDFIDQHKGELGNYKFVEAVNTRLNEISRKRKALGASKALSNSEIIAKDDELLMERNRILSYVDVLIDRIDNRKFEARHFREILKRIENAGKDKKDSRNTRMLLRELSDMR